MRPENCRLGLRDPEMPGSSCLKLLRDWCCSSVQYLYCRHVAWSSHDDVGSPWISIFYLFFHSFDHDDLTFALSQFLPPKAPSVRSVLGCPGAASGPGTASEPGQCWSGPGLRWFRASSELSVAEAALSRWHGQQVTHYHGRRGHRLELQWNNSQTSANLNFK